MLIAESFRQERFIWGGIALITGILTLYSMSKIWLEGFWKPAPELIEGNRQLSHSTGADLKFAYAAVIGLSVVILWLGVYPEPVIVFLHTHSTNFWSMP